MKNRVIKARQNGGFVTQMENTANLSRPLFIKINGADKIVKKKNTLVFSIA